MLKTTSQLTKRVRVALGLSEGSTQIWQGEDPDIVTIDSLIRSVLTRAVDKVNMTADPLRLTDVTHDLASADIFWRSESAGNSYGHILLPDNCARVAYFKMSDWTMDVRLPVNAGDADEILITSRIQAFQGTPQRPRCLITNIDGAIALEFHSCHDSSATIERAAYIAYSRIDRHDCIEVARHCLDEIIDTAAQMVKDKQL